MCFILSTIIIAGFYISGEASFDNAIRIITFRSGLRMLNLGVGYFYYYILFLTYMAIQLFRKH